MTLTHDVLWKFPLFFIAYPLNSVWLCEIFEETYKERYNIADNGETTNVYQTFLRKIADLILQTLLLLVVMLQIGVVKAAGKYLLYLATLPFGFGALGWMIGEVLGIPLGLVYDSWLYSFYAFTSRLDQSRNVTLKKKIRYFHAHWMYFLGFGLPPSILLWWLAEYDVFLSSVMYFVLLPVHAMLSVPAQPEKQQTFAPLPFFHYAGATLTAILPSLVNR